MIASSSRREDLEADQIRTLTARGADGFLLIWHRSEFDDTELASNTDPALTTVHVPHTQMGRQAAKTLVGILNGDIQGQSVELSTNLCLHKSFGRSTKKLR